MTGKERAQFRAQANTLDPLFQIGKGGMSDALIAQIEDAFRTRELIKLKVLLESAPETPREFADKIAAATGSEVIQVIGGSLVFYRENPDLGKEKEKKKPAKKRQAAFKGKGEKSGSGQKRGGRKETEKRFLRQKKNLQLKK